MQYFFRKSLVLGWGGGATLSGGECTLYPDYLEPLLKGLKERQIHVTLETSGYFDSRAFRKKILPSIDLICYDIKIADHQVHRRYLGRSNRRILQNLQRLIREKGVGVHPRVSLVPGITASRGNLSAIIVFLPEAAARDVSLIPYNPMGIEMARCLGRRKPLLPERFMQPDEQRERVALFR